LANFSSFLVKASPDRAGLTASRKTHPPATWGRIELCVFATALAYATARYNVFKGVRWSEWPTYTLNKGLGLASLALIVLTIFRLGGRRTTSVAPLMSVAAGLALAHILLSLALLNPAYYAKFFDGAKLTGLASVAIAFGVLSAVLMQRGQRHSHDWSAGRRYTVLAMIALCASLHAAFPGFMGWFDPASWPGGLPPITLLSFLLGAIAIMLRLLRSQNRG
jgi:hypothetical protein